MSEKPMPLFSTFLSALKQCENAIANNSVFAVEMIHENGECGEQLYVEKKKQRRYTYFVLKYFQMQVKSFTLHKVSPALRIRRQTYKEQSHREPRSIVPLALGLRRQTHKKQGHRAVCWITFFFILVHFMEIVLFFSGNRNRS